jgi:dolichyl-diphosphooligosaccharide--protein glycosyltransferase
MVTAEEVRELTEERPDLEPAVVAVLDADPPFAFEDVDLDSGSFGELVSRGIVEKHDGAYRVADRNAVDLGLSGDVSGKSDEFFSHLGDVTLPVSRLELALPHGVRHLGAVLAPSLIDL